jgi:hypothetical protein
VKDKARRFTPGGSFGYRLEPFATSPDLLVAGVSTRSSYPAQLGLVSGAVLEAGPFYFRPFHSRAFCVRCATGPAAEGGLWQNHTGDK